MLLLPPFFNKGADAQRGNLSINGIQSWSFKGQIGVWNSSGRDYWTGSRGDVPFPCLDGSGWAVTAGVSFTILSVVPVALPQNSLFEGATDALARFPAHAPQHGQPIGLHRDCLIIGLLGHLWVQEEEGQSDFAYSSRPLKCICYHLLGNPQCFFSSQLKGNFWFPLAIPHFMPLVQSFNKYWQSTYAVPGTVLGAGDKAMDKTDKISWPCGAYVLIVGHRRNKIHKTGYVRWW